MAFEKKDMTGTLFDNDRITNDKQPQLTGWIMIDGKEYKLAAWKKQTREGKEMLSLKVDVRQ